MLVVAGLGNPGPRYAQTRHNAGFMLVSALAERVAAPSWRDKFHGEFSRLELSSEELFLLRPMTFMNESGRSVQALLSFFRIDPSSLLVVHDELDLNFGMLRLKLGGGHAGHNGLRSIVQYLGTSEFMRLRVGIGRPPRDFGGDGADYVLSEPSNDEKAKLPEVIDAGAKALLDVVRRGFVPAMNRLNVKPKPKQPPAAQDAAKEVTARDEQSLAQENKER